MNTKQELRYTVGTMVFSIYRFGPTLKVIRMGNGQCTDQFNLDEDPQDLVGEEIGMTFIELCPVEMTEQEMLHLYEDIYTSISIFYALRTMELVRGQNGN